MGAEALGVGSSLGRERPTKSLGSGEGRSQGWRGEQLGEGEHRTPKGTAGSAGAGRVKTGCGFGACPLLCPRRVALDVSGGVGRAQGEREEIVARGSERLGRRQGKGRERVSGG